MRHAAARDVPHFLFLDMKAREWKVLEVAGVVVLEMG
jgi:hypothetical protein